MANVSRIRILAAISAVMFVFTIFWGCAPLKTGTESSEEIGPVASTQDTSQASLYYDFEDILVPSELKVDKKRTFVYYGPTFTAGVLALAGRVEVNSLIKFFENNMAKDDWRLISSFKSAQALMFFNKSNRGCVINITEKQFNTKVEIWVVPAMETLQEGVLK